MFHFRKRYQTWPHYSNQFELYRELFRIFNVSHPEVNELKFNRNLVFTLKTTWESSNGTAFGPRDSTAGNDTPDDEKLETSITNMYGGWKPWRYHSKIAWKQTVFHVPLGYIIKYWIAFTRPFPLTLKIRQAFSLRYLLSPSTIIYR